MFPTAIIFNINKLLSAVRLYHSDVVSRKYLKLYEVYCDLRSFPDGKNVFPKMPTFPETKVEGPGKNIIQAEKRFPKKHSDYLLKPFGFSNPQG